MNFVSATSTPEGVLLQSDEHTAHEWVVCPNRGAQVLVTNIRTGEMSLVDRTRVEELLSEYLRRAS